MKKLNEMDSDMIVSIEMWLHEIEPKWVEKELAWLGELRTRLAEQPVSDCHDLEEEVKRYYSENFSYITSDNPTLSILTNIARHFAKWGAEHLADANKMISGDLEKKTFDDYIKASPAERRKMNMAEILGEDRLAKTKEQMDLEEAAWDCVLDSVDVNNPVLLPKYKELLTYLFIAGAKWQKAKMIEGAVECIVSAGKDNNRWLMTYVGDYESMLKTCKTGDKTKIIIVKEDG